MEYNINEIVEWLKGKASECGDNYSLQRKYFDAIIYLHRLDVVLKRIALEKVDVATMATEPAEENTEEIEVATNTTDAEDSAQADVTEEEIEATTVTKDTDATTEEAEA